MRDTIRLFAAILFGAFMIAAESQQASPPTGEGPPVESQGQGTVESQQNAQQQTGDAQTPSLPTNEQSTATQVDRGAGEPGPEQNTAEQAIADYTFGLAWATGILAGATIALAWFTLMLLFAGKNTAKQELRAYISTIGCSVQRDGAHRVKCTVSFQNTGQTPASNVVANIGYAIADYPADGIIGAPAEQRDQHRGTLGPSVEAEAILDGNGIIGALDWQAIGNKTKVLYVFGRIDYKDAFERAQWTKFRFKFFNMPNNRPVEFDAVGNDAT